MTTQTDHSIVSEDDVRNITRAVDKRLRRQQRNLTNHRRDLAARALAPMRLEAVENRRRRHAALKP